MSEPVGIDDLKVELEEWFRRLSRTAERWVAAKAAGLDTAHYDRQMREAERHARRLERQIKRRSR